MEFREWSQTKNIDIKGFQLPVSTQGTWGTYTKKKVCVFTLFDL